jgi:hypothetical protein
VRACLNKKEKEKRKKRKKENIQTRSFLGLGHSSVVQYLPSLREAMGSIQDKKIYIYIF